MSSMAASRGRGGAAAASPVNQRAVDFRRQLDTHTRTLVESFGSLLRSAKITHPQNIAREDFQVNVATASLATAGEGLLRQIREVKLAVMLQDEAAMDREMDQALSKIASEREELEKELEALSNEVKAAYAKAAMEGQASSPQASTAVGREQEAAPPAPPPVPALATAPPPIPLPTPAVLDNAVALEGQDGFASLPGLAPAAVAMPIQPLTVKDEADVGADVGAAAAAAAAATATAVSSDMLGSSMDVVGVEGLVGEAGKEVEGEAGGEITR